MRPGRPPLPLGTHGAIRVYPSQGRGEGFRARVLFRDFDGRTREVERTARTRAAAIRTLQVALRDRARVGASGGELTRDSTVAELAELWFGSLTGLAPTTIEFYRARLDHQVVPALGGLRLRELSVAVLDRHLRTVSERIGPGSAKSTKTVLSGMCTLATRYDALDRNIVRDASIGPLPPRRPPRALSVEEVRRLRTALDQDPLAVERDVPDLVGFMLATGVRLGEAMALQGEDVDLPTGAVHVRRNAVILKGQGVVLKAPKTAAGTRVIELPSWGIELLRGRTLEPGKAVFPAPKGGLRERGNTERHLRQAFAAAGFAGLTSHVFRKTVATMMDEAGLSARKAADQLGHADVTVTQNAYFGRKQGSTGAAAALESLG